MNNLFTLGLCVSAVLPAWQQLNLSIFIIFILILKERKDVNMHTESNGLNDQFSISSSLFYLFWVFAVHNFVIRRLCLHKQLPMCTL